MGCRASDHGLSSPCAVDSSPEELEKIVNDLRMGRSTGRTDGLKLKSALMAEFGRMDSEKGWVMQLHLGALRNNNTRLFKKLGPDLGFDSIGDFEVALPLSRFLDRLDQENRLPKTILYNLNPRDNEVVAAMIGNFQDGSIPGKIQYGSGWWFLDQKDGMMRQLCALSNMGLLSRFVGMLTDSRSLLSFPRHEYFRRILCNMVGHDMENGEIPDDMNMVGGMVANICFRNAREYFGVEM
jgi:glucuronate isomerase